MFLELFVVIEYPERMFICIFGMGPHNFMSTSTTIV